MWRVQKTALGGVAEPMASPLLQEKLERVILGSKAAQQNPAEVRSLWQTCGELMFSLEPRLRHLGLGKEVRPPNHTGERNALKLPGMEGRVPDRQWALPHSLKAELLTRLWASVLSFVN